VAALGSSGNVKAKEVHVTGKVKGTVVTSVIFLTAGRNLFFKVRVSAPEGSPVFSPPERERLLRDLGDLIDRYIQR
jgi:hypothetical protein